MTCEECRELLPAYAAGALDPTEAAVVRAHLASGCAACAIALAELEATLAHLPLALDPVKPSDAARNKLMARVQSPKTALAFPSGEGGVKGASKREGRESRTPVIESTLTPALSQRKMEPDVERSTASISLAPRWLSYAAAAAIVVMVGGIIWQRSRLSEWERAHRDVQARLDQARADTASVASRAQDELKAKNTQLSEQLEALAAQATELAQIKQMVGAQNLNLVAFNPTDPTSGAKGRIFWDKEHNRWHVYVFDMKPPGAGKVFELWYITPDQKKIPAGTFNVDKRGNGVIVTDIPKDIGAIQLAAITDEPVGGSPQPTGTIQLVSEVGAK